MRREWVLLRCEQRPTMELNASVWSNLPSELLEQVLPFVPVLDLCKFRSVCKRWDALIRTPDFGALCVRNAATGVTNGACFVAKLRLNIHSTKTGNTLKESSSWSICDLSTKRWFNVKDELPKSCDDCVMDMDAGLVCVFGDPLTDEQRYAATVSTVLHEPQILMVFNLIEQRVKVLPNPPGPLIFRWRTSLQLVVDPISQDFRVFLISTCCLDSHHQCIRVYNSSTNQWKVFPNPLAQYPGPQQHLGGVIYQGAFFVLFFNQMVPACRLFRYSFVEENWEDTGVIHRFWKVWGGDGIMNSCKLVVSDNRLFLMTQYMIQQAIVGLLNPKPRKPWPLDISEIFLEQKLCETVAQLTEKEVYDYFGIQLEDQPCFQMHAVGFDKSILLTVEEFHEGASNYMLYNVVTKSWESLPPNPVEHLRVPRGYRRTMCRNGKHMSYLRLPNTPLG